MIAMCAERLDLFGTPAVVLERGFSNECAISWYVAAQVRVANRLQSAKGKIRDRVR
jgi:hypothetical protein